MLHKWYRQDKSMRKARITYRNEILSNDVQKLIRASELGYHKLAVTEIISTLWEAVGVLN